MVSAGHELVKVLSVTGTAPLLDIPRSSAPKQEKRNGEWMDGKRIRWAFSATSQRNLRDICKNRVRTQMDRRIRAVAALEAERLSLELMWQLETRFAFAWGLCAFSGRL